MDRAEAIEKAARAAFKRWHENDRASPITIFDDEMVELAQAFAIGAEPPRGAKMLVAPELLADLLLEGLIGEARFTGASFDEARGLFVFRLEGADVPQSTEFVTAIHRTRLVTTTLKSVPAPADAAPKEKPNG